MAHTPDTAGQQLRERSGKNIRSTQIIMARLYARMAEVELPQRRPAEDFPELAAFQ